jgi:hypothetical protein
VFRELAHGAKTDRAQLRKAITALEAGNVVRVTRLDRLTRSTRDLLKPLAAITAGKAGLRSLARPVLLPNVTIEREEDRPVQKCTGSGARAGTGSATVASAGWRKYAGLLPSRL